MEQQDKIKKCLRKKVPKLLNNNMPNNLLSKDKHQKHHK